MTEKGADIACKIVNLNVNSGLVEHTVLVKWNCTDRKSAAELARYIRSTYEEVSDVSLAAHSAEVQW